MIYSDKGLRNIVNGKQVRLRAGHGLSFLFCLLVFFTGTLYAQNPVPAAVAPGVRINYVRTWNATAPEQSTTNLVTRALTDVKQNTQYYDGFGRPVESVMMKGSPLGNDVVNADYYDAATGNETYRYLPYASNAATSGDNTSDGNFKLDRFQQEVAFYNGYLSNQAGETSGSSATPNWAYGKTNYESSPMNRVLNSYGPGVNWAGSEGAANNNVSQQHLVNTATDNVQEWSIATTTSSPELFPQSQVIPTNLGAYAAGELYKTVITDEQKHQAIEFRDQYGQLILKKVQNTAVADNGTGSAHAGWLCTYFVYDDYGKMRFIITPNVVQLIDGNWTGITQSYVDELCYYFEFDNQDRMVVKKTPGTPTGINGELWMVYDERNRLVMEQDGNMRSNQLWKYFVYDGLDRVVGTGLLTDASANLTNYNDLNSHLNAALASITWPSLGSYTTETLTQLFYDNYNWMSAGNSSTLPSTLNATASGTGNTVFTTTYNASPNYAQALTQTKMTHGMLIGTKTEVMGSNQGSYLYSVSYYDAKGRTIQTQKINNMSGTDITTVQYCWDGRPLQSVTANAIPSTTSVNPQTHVVSSALAYDAMGRLLSVTKTINSTIGGSPVTASSLIVTNQYDELSQLKKKILGNNLESLTYDYDVRGWLLGENRDYAKTPLSTTNYFGYDIGYDKTAIVPTGGSSIGSYTQALYNGNIEGVVWKSKGDGVARKYDYAYDNANRLTAAPYHESSAVNVWNNSPIDFSVTGIGFDANGNIGGLQQNGFSVSSSGPIDNLNYAYVNGKDPSTGANYSNRLLTVMDGSNNPQSTLGDLHYASSKPGGNTDYTYNNNGSITSDYNRSVSSITYYNDLNLPKQLTVTNEGTIQYLYDASGNKLQKQAVQTNATVVYNGTSYPTTITTTTKYLDGFVYKTINYSSAGLSALNTNNTDVLQYMGQEEGRIRFKPVGSGNPTASFVFDYFIRDHLGSVRMVLTDEQVQDNYPPATLETASIGGGTAQSYESAFYNIKTSNVVVTATDTRTSAWFAAATNSSYPNQNNYNGNPPNNDIFSNTTANSANVYWLNGVTGDKTGLGITLKVMAGDKVNIYGKSVWHNTGTAASYQAITASPLINFLTAFGGSSAVYAGGHGLITATGLSNTTATTGPLTTMLNTTPGQTANTTYAPKAAINWILFDNQFRPVANGIGTSLVNSSPDQVYAHVIGLNIPMNQSGYLYVYCSNESNIDVFFDNLQVLLTHGPMVEETHYYPFGLTMAGISDRAFGKQVNFAHYQGNEMQNQEWNDGTGLEEYDFKARYYDQQLGAWHTQDPIINAPSPYSAMTDNPASVTDANGQCPICIVLIAAAVIGGGLDDLANKGNIHNFWQGLGYFVAGAIAADAAVLGDASDAALADLGSTGWLGSALAAFGTFASASGFSGGVAADLAGNFTATAFAVGGVTQVLADGAAVGFKNLDFGQYVGDFLGGGLDGMSAASYANIASGFLGVGSQMATMVNGEAKYVPLSNSFYPELAAPSKGSLIGTMIATAGQNFSVTDVIGATIKSLVSKAAGDWRGLKKDDFGSYLEGGLTAGLGGWGGDAASGILKIPNLGQDVLQFIGNTIQSLISAPKGDDDD